MADELNYFPRRVIGMYVFEIIFVVHFSYPAEVNLREKGKNHSAAAWSMPSEMILDPERRVPSPMLQGQKGVCVACYQKVV